MRSSILGRRLTHGLVATGLALSAVVAVPLPAQAEDGPLRSGDGWSVTDLGGAYEVTVELDEPLPIKSDAPTIEADGHSIGLAAESADGSTLTAITSDRSVLSATTLEPGWSSVESADLEDTADSRQAVAAAPDATDEQTEIADDPAALGTYAWDEDIYDFGDQSIDLVSIGGIRGEVRGKVYLPRTGGSRPVVIFMHGRHTSCSQGTANPLRWPCGPNQVRIPSYQGYDDAARVLASHGYAVVSISANAINANDNQLSIDYGQLTRGQLTLDTLSLLKEANEGKQISLHDDALDRDVTLDQALAETDDAMLDTAHEGSLAAKDLVGRFDFSSIGLMGHSRGGEGVASAAVLNAALDEPWAIRSVLPLAPVDFNRFTIPDVTMMTLLPYCDGDVSNQQGQHMFDDSRYAFDDDVLRSAVWVMGADHNFFNTVWTPGRYPYSVSDDWSRTTDPVCGTDASVAGTSIRLSAADQYDVGTALVAGFFRLTQGEEKEFLPIFDGTGAVAGDLVGKDIRTTAVQAPSSRQDVETFTEAGNGLRPYGTASIAVCASQSGRPVSQQLPGCATTALASAQIPHWAAMRWGEDAPSSPMAKLSWTSATGEVRITVPRAARDASAHQRLSLKVAADESVAASTDLTITLVDGSGKAVTKKVSELNPLALQRMPISTGTGAAMLGKIVLQQVNLPLEGLGIDVSDLREVRLGAGTETAGAVLLSDLALESPSLGNPESKTRSSVNVGAQRVDEGSGPGTVDVAVALDRPSDEPVVAYASVLGTASATSKVGRAMQKVTFAPGEVCKVVSGPTYGDADPSAAANVDFRVSVTNTGNGVMGTGALDWLTVREDDGLTGSATPLPAVGTPGDACAELAARGTVQDLTVSDATPGPGETTTLSAAGFRAGESVAITLDDARVADVVADATGAVSYDLVVPADAATGPVTVTAEGAGSLRTAAADLTVLATTATTLTIDPALPSVNQPVTLTATVSGATSGTVTFTDGATTLGTADVVEGAATLKVAGLKAGTHALAASYAATATTDASVSETTTLTLEKGRSTVALTLSATRSTFGSRVTGTVAVAGAATGPVEVRYGSTTARLTARAGKATFTLPATLVPGTYPVRATFLGTDEVAPSATATATLRIAKKATTTAVSSKGSVKRGKKLTIRASVRGAVAGTQPTGTVKVYVKKGSGSYKVVKTVRLTVSKKGTVTVTYKAPDARKLRVKVVYSGDVRYGASTSAVRTVTVKR
ncbi:Ig-like domain repeat protein [Mumia sp. DW29H23]|uniref:Ig-like domain repeat protein n=1 Tax=Mumia sp. DW29H23 TaxID=3421241 RepID=UPI003D68B0FC